LLLQAFENKFMGLQPVPGTTPMKRQGKLITLHFR